MAFAFTEGSETISTTEWSLPRDASYNASSLQTVDAVVQFAIDGSAIVAGEVYRARLYRKVNGTVRVVHEVYIPHGSAILFPFVPVQMPAAGWDVTLVKVSGTDRSIPWSDGRQTAEPTAAAIAAAVAAPSAATIAAAVLAAVVEGAETVGDTFRLITARLFGKATVQSGDGSYAFRDKADTKDRIAGAISGTARTVTTRDGT